MRYSQTVSLPAAALWASAFVIGALTIVQTGRLPQAAYGEMSASHGDYTILTTDSGRGGDLDPDELLYVIDNRTEVLLVYEIEDARRGQVILRDGWSLRALFHRARR
ncbi:MAG: hypothetical protein IH888_11885 [Planctomycetes bacterium]|nr:hypothetical protein [Planctomycetota bacterium]